MPSTHYYHYAIMLICMRTNEIRANIKVVKTEMVVNLSNSFRW